MPADPQVLGSLAAVLQEQGKFDEALECHRQALEMDPALPGAQFNMAALLQLLGRLEEAAAGYRQLIEWQPDHAVALINLGVVLKELGRVDEALAALRRAVALLPESAEAWNNLGTAVEASGDVPGALDCYRKALELQPDFAQAANNLGASYLGLGRFDDARCSIARAIEARPEYPEALYNLGTVLQAEGKFDAALALYDRVLRAGPGFDEVLWARALTLLAKGDFARGWREYELRHDRQVIETGIPKPDYAFPLWLGEPLAGKRLLLAHEQGYGDQIQFVRYASLLARQGAQVDVLARKPVERLFQSVPGVRRVVTDVPRKSALYDYWSPMASSPLRMGTVLETVPAQVPYLHAPDEAVRKWAAKLATLPGGNIKVGLIWAGNPGYKSDRYRSMPFQALLPLATARNVSYVSVQTGAAGAEARDAGFPALHLGEELGDFADTAGLFMNLDLLLAVDTAFAHLAGALGRPVWLLQAAVPDWRWLRDRADSPWYPTMRLMTQDTLGDWQPLIARVVRDFSTLAAK